MTVECKNSASKSFPQLSKIDWVKMYQLINWNVMFLRMCVWYVYERENSFIENWKMSVGGGLLFNIVHAAKMNDAINLLNHMHSEKCVAWHERPFSLSEGMAK